MDYKPKEGETYTSFSTSEHHESSDINGVKSSSGGSSVKVNDNGEVQAKAVEFKGGDDVPTDINET